MRIPLLALFCLSAACAAQRSSARSDPRISSQVELTVAQDFNPRKWKRAALAISAVSAPDELRDHAMIFTDAIRSEAIKHGATVAETGSETAFSCDDPAATARAVAATMAHKMTGVIVATMRREGDWLVVKGCLVGIDKGERVSSFEGRARPEKLLGLPEIASQNMRELIRIKTSTR
jgi:hypothetical protein